MQSKIVWVIGFAYALFHVYTSGFGLLPELPHRALHVAFALILIVLATRATKRPAGVGLAIFQWVMVGLIALSIVPVLLNHSLYLTFRAPFEWYEIAAAVVLTVMLLEASRRTTGWTFPILIALAFVYVLFGPYFPGSWGHAGQSVTQTLRGLYQGDLGIWGYITSISSDVVAIFVVFGAFIATSGAGETFIKVAYRVAGRLAGGPAMVAVIGSGLMGMISGSAIANVSTTGTMTIPAMKRAGYRPEFAAAVEASASTGGMMTPPVMAAVAFVMATLLSVSYLQIMIYAAIPAALYS